MTNQLWDCFHNVTVSVIFFFNQAIASFNSIEKYIFDKLFNEQCSVLQKRYVTIFKIFIEIDGIEKHVNHENMSINKVKNII